MDKKGLLVAWVSNSTVDIDAEYLEIDGCGFASVDLTVDLSSPGANGLDTGEEANSTGYYLWVIADSGGDTVAGLASLSATAPTMPDGYDCNRLVGWAWNDGSGHITPFLMEGDEWIFDCPVTAAPFRFISGGTSTNFADSTALVMPGISSRALVGLYVTRTTVGPFWMTVIPKGSSITGGIGRRIYCHSYDGNAVAIEGQFQIRTGSAHKVQYKVSGAGVSGYADQIGFYFNP